MRFLFSFFIFLSLALLLINNNGVRANEPTPSTPPSASDNNNKDKDKNKAVNPDPFHLHFPSPHQPDLFHSLSNDFQSLRSSISQQMAAIDEKMRSHRQQMEKHFQDVWASVNVNNPLEQFQSITNTNTNNNNKPSIPVTGDNPSPPSSSSPVAPKTEAGPLSSSPSVTHSSISLSKVDLIEQNDRYLINAELAGIPKDKISITVDNGLITIEGKNEQKKEGGGENEKYHYSERSYSSVKRSLRIPSDVDPSSIRANYENGLLTIQLPKNNQPNKPPTQIHIQ